MTPTRRSRPLTNALAASLLLVAAHAARAQQPDASWTAFAPAGEEFAALVPVEPKVKTQPALPAVGSPAGRLYFAKQDLTEYRVWSFESAPTAADDALAVSDFLDSCAALAWTIVVEPEFQQASRAGSRGSWERYRMAFVRELRLGEERHGYLAREYTVSLSERRGRAYLFTDGARAYVALAYGQGVAGDANVRAFLDSFTLRTPEGALVKMPDADAASPPALVPLSTQAGGVGPGRGESTGGAAPNASDFGAQPAPAPSCDELGKRTFTQKEVATRAHVFAKPDPMYTEWARKFLVTGTVRLRAVLHSDGTVGDIAVIKSLPHGLTHTAIDAMRRVQFEPAQKDGCKVSQFVLMEYNYNIY